MLQIFKHPIIVFAFSSAVSFMFSSSAISSTVLMMVLSRVISSDVPIVESRFCGVVLVRSVSSHPRGFRRLFSMCRAMVSPIFLLGERPIKRLTCVGERSMAFAKAARVSNSRASVRALCNLMSLISFMTLPLFKVNILFKCIFLVHGLAGTYFLCFYVPRRYILWV